MLSACLCISSLLTFECLNKFYETLLYIMTPELVLTAYFINPSYQCVFMCIPLSLLGNGYVKKLPQQIHNRIVGHVVFYSVRAVSKESRRSVLPRTSC
jgi:hypothetical protein